MSSCDLKESHRDQEEPQAVQRGERAMGLAYEMSVCAHVKCRALNVMF